jgi:hypothetical protein
MIVDLIHLAETIFVISKPHLVRTWPLFLGVASAIWGEVKIIRIKYRIIRRTFNVDWNNNDTCLQSGGTYSSNIGNTGNRELEDSCKSVNNKYGSVTSSGEDIRLQSSQTGFCLKTNIINFIKLVLAKQCKSLIQDYLFIVTD